MSVGLRPGLHKNYCADFHETWTKDGSRLRIEPIKFPCGSGWRDRANKCFVSFFNIGRKPPVRRQPVSMSEHTRRLMVLGEGLLVYFRIFISSCIFIFALQLSFKAKRGTVGRDEAETVFGGGRKKKKMPAETVSGSWRWLTASPIRNLIWIFVCILWQFQRSTCHIQHVQSNRFKLLKKKVHQKKQKLWNVSQPLQKQFNGIHRRVWFPACMFFSWTRSFVRKAFSSANVALVLHSPPPAGESSSSRRESCLLPLYSPTARCIQMRPDYAKYLFTHLRAEKTGIEIFGMKGLYLCLPLW